MTQLGIPNLPAGGFDWPSLGFALVLGLVTVACLWIKTIYPRIEAMGAAARILANMVIGYFGFAMLGFGLTSALRSYLPVPGGTAWQGPVAVIGGIAAMIVGGSTLAEHAIQLAGLRKATLTHPETATVRADAS